MEGDVGWMKGMVRGWRGRLAGNRDCMTGFWLNGRVFDAKLELFHLREFFFDDAVSLASKAGLFFDAKLGLLHLRGESSHCSGSLLTWGVEGGPCAALPLPPRLDPTAGTVSSTAVGFTSYFPRRAEIW